MICENLRPINLTASKEEGHSLEGEGVMNFELKEMLEKMVEAKASDLYFKVDSPPYLRIDGKLEPTGGEPLAPKDSEELASNIMNERQRKHFQEKSELDLAYHLPEVGRFRANIFRQRGYVGLVFRLVRTDILSFEELNLPPKILRQLSLEPRGLVLVTGIAGSGKSTTLAAMVDYINAHRKAHIVTIEDPIEFLHEDKKSIISQREVGIDTDTFADALRHVIRQSPDVILIGEMRDLETISAAITAAETGHLVLSTLHTIDATQTLERIINFFPPYQHEEIRTELSFILKGVISLRLLPRASGKGRIPAVATMLSTPTVRKLILEGRTTDLYGAIEKGNLFGMQTFNQALVKLYQEGLVSFDDALESSDSPDEFRLIAEGIRTGTGSIEK